MKCLCLPDPVTRRSTTVDHVRLFRRHPALRWRYRVHEQILPSLKELGGTVQWSDVVIHDTGYQEPGLRQRKLERDFRLLVQDYEEQRGDPFRIPTRSVSEGAAPSLTLRVGMGAPDPFVLFNLGMILHEWRRYGERCRI
jgi:hypothetical protein